MKKKSILVFNKFYIPGYKAGGPIRTIANMADRLSNDFFFKVVTLDRDAGDTEPYSDVSRSSWNNLGSAQVFYFDPAAVSLSQIQKIIQDVSPDAIYLNSFFDVTFTQRILLLRKLGKLSNVPIVLAPRGEFSEGALAIKKPKKLAYIFLSRLTGLYKNITWQASSELEKKDIQRVFPNIQDEEIHIAMNLAPAMAKNGSNTVKTKLPNNLKIVFLSRLSPKKNLDYALRVLQKVRAQVEFTIYGPKEVPAYWKECISLINNLPDNIQVSWGGGLTPEQVHATLAEHHIFFFPTRGENYGHVIHEALSSGLPVLISDQTPWQDLEQAGVGWVLPLSTPEQFAQKIEEVAGWDSTELSRVSCVARKYAADKASDDLTIEANCMLFRNAIIGRN